MCVEGNQAGRHSLRWSEMGLRGEDAAFGRAGTAAEVRQKETGEGRERARVTGIVQMWVGSVRSTSI